MNYLIIKFPFQSVNDEQYYLALCIHHPTTLQPALDALNADSEVFTQGLTADDGTNTTYNYTGTLTGSVVVSDDEREDIYEPLVKTKLQFNMAVQTFPEWLMMYSDLRWVSVILYKEDNENNYELWRGYLMSQSLNMTVVNNLLSCNLVAVDEIGMAKYMPLNKNLPSNWHTIAIVTLMEYYHMIHYYNGYTIYGVNGIGFYDYYLKLGLTDSNKMLWHRNMALEDDDGNLLGDLPVELVVNLDRWLQDDEATWENLFDDIFRYLAVTFCIGSWSGLTSNDGYLLSCPTDSATIKKYEFIFGGAESQVDSDLFNVLSNPDKIGANLQVTVEPDKYKSVTVESEPKRWERHDYLQENNYPEVDSSKSIRYEWGTTSDATNGPFETFNWHKLYYIKPTDEETDYVELPECQDGEGLIMAQNGYLPYDSLSSCTGLTQPTSAVADSLDFITFKEGATCIKIGSGEIGGIDEDSALTPYFIILNHMWSNMWNRPVVYTMQTEHLADTTFLKFMPFAAGAPTHPAEQHYLMITMQVKFIRENMAIGAHSDGDPHWWLWFPSPGVGSSMQVLNWNSPAMLMPSENSEFPDFEVETSGFTGHIDSWNTLYFVARVRCGSYYWNGSNWVTTESTCNMTLWSDTNEITEIDKYGYKTIETKNYYYTFASPYGDNARVDRNNNPELLIGCGGASIHNAPFQGQLTIEILGQVRFQNHNNNSVYNSVPFILIDKVDIGWTDEAEMLSKDIKNENTVYMDYYSETKEEMTRSLEMASPTVDGFFNNTLVYDGRKSWHNLTTAVTQYGGTVRQPEQMLALKLSSQYGAGQCFVEFATPIDYDDNLHNVSFKVNNLTEADGTFMPVKREFDYTRERLRMKLQRVNGASD